MAYTPISNLPTPPSRQEPATFSVRADAFLGALPTFGTQVNAAGDYIDGKGAEVDATAAAAAASAAAANNSASSAALSKDIAQAAANYKGDYNAGTTYQIGDSVSFESKIFAAKTVNTGVTPVSGANWLDITIAAVKAPTAISPDNATGVLPQPTLTASVYSPLYSSDARSVREFQLTTFADTGYAAPVFTSSVNADTVVVSPALALETQFRWRCRDVATSGATSQYSNEGVFTTTNTAVNAPTLTVEGSPTDVPETPTLTTGAFATTPTGQDTHASTNWIVRLAADDTIVYQSLADTVNLLSIIVPAGLLLANTSYKFQAQHVGTTFGASAVTEVTATTLAAFAPAIGEAFGGGFFTGEIWLNGGELYRLVVAPKASGESAPVTYKPTSTASPSATRTLNNGLSSTTAMVAAGSHPAAAFCDGLNIGGFSDWYLPARDEFELAYRNLKPTTTNNNIDVRAPASFAYPEGNDISTDTMGINRNSNPTGVAYTSVAPAQTTVPAFVTGNTEAFSLVNYWTSTERGADQAWGLRFETGQSTINLKEGPLTVRAFRRELVSPNIGDFVFGGYFGGTIYEGGVPYYLIVAPKASGENASVQFKTTNTASPVATQTLNNGPAATAAMVAAGSHPAADFCAGLTINGFSDWYMPARDELEILYRTLKPTTDASGTTNRVKSDIVYPEGDDISSDTFGFNRNSVNINTGYTSTIPPQTSLALFQTGGTEAFSSAFYWSSSEFSNITAWMGFFGNGTSTSNNDGKSDPRYVRAIRRVAV